MQCESSGHRAALGLGGPVALALLLLFVASSCDAEREPPPDPSVAIKEALEAGEAALKARQWDEAIAHAQQVSTIDSAAEDAEAIITRARREQDNRAWLEQAQALFDAEQFVKAFAKVGAIPKRSAYRGEANALSLKIRQAVVLPASVRRRGGIEMRRILLGAYSRGSSEKEVNRVVKECKKDSDQCLRKWFDRESPRRRIQIDSFYLDRTEVSIGAYEACVSGGGCKAIPWNECTTQDSSPDVPWRGSEMPQVCVRWDDADAYCRWANARLPTEAEWERAARGPDHSRYPWGPTFDPFAANWGDGGTQDGYVGPAEVSAFPPTGYGLHNMAGNVYEWVSDWHEEGYYASSPADNPTGPAEGVKRIYRGGSYQRAQLWLRAAHRLWVPPDERHVTVGFRCATSPLEMRLPNSLPAAPPEPATGEGATPAEPTP